MYLMNDGLHPLVPEPLDGSELILGGADGSAADAVIRNATSPANRIEGICKRVKVTPWSPLRPRGHREAL